MEKEIRNAVRCFIIKDNQVVCIKYLEGRIGYYDIAGGKIEEGESAEETVKREVFEETGIEVITSQYKGKMCIEYPNRKFIFKVYVATQYKGEPQNFQENSSEWIEINKLLSKEKIFSVTIILENHLRKCLLDNNKTFELYMIVDNNENILDMKFKYIK